MAKIFTVPFDDDNFFDPEAAQEFSESGIWSSHQEMLFDNGSQGLGWDDEYAQALFYMGYVDHDVLPPDREMYQQTLQAYFEDEYDIDFDDLFDHDAWAQEFYSND